MPTIKYKSNPNEDTAYYDGHKVQLIAVPSGTLQSPIHPTSDAGYVIDGNGEKHRVLMAYFMSGTPDYKPNETCDTAYLTVSGRKIKVRLACKERGNLTLSTKTNVNKGYVVGGDGKKHRAILVNTPTGTLQLPNNETDDSAYVVDNNGKKTKVRLFLLLSGGSVEVIVKGVSPLSLPDAVANTLSYVKAFGGTEQNGTPTPTNPIDIVSNNGVLKARHQSGLPLGYTLLDYIKSTGTQYIDTGINQTTLVKPRIITKFKFGETGDKDWFGGSNDNADGIIWNIAPNTTRIAYIRWKTQAARVITYESGYSVSDLVFFPNFHTLDVGGVEESGVVPIMVDNNLIANMDSTTTLAWANHNLLIFRSGRSGQNGACSFSYFTIYSNDVKVWDGVACRRNSDNVLGMYDLVSGQFFTNAGTGDFVAGNPVSDPVEIYTDGTVETIKDSLNNTATAEMLLKVGNYQDVQSIIDGAITRNIGVKVLDGTENWSLWRNGYTTMVLRGIARARTVPLSNITESVSSKIELDGSADLNFYNIVTDFPTVTDWKRYIADQYNAGTPVIVIYPLAEPTTESVAGQTLQVQAGDNVLEITQASLNNLELEAEYQAAVSLTIQEVQDANLDPNVEVTIN